jgi:NAD(P)H-quinone oxidoreductase subunit 5
MDALHAWLPWLPWLAPTIHAVGVLLAARSESGTWHAVALSTRLALAAAVAALVLPWIGAAGTSGAAPWVATLIAFLGWVIGDFSRRYLRGEPGQRRFAVAYLGTLAAVGAVVASTNLAALILAWALSSAGLHSLLTFYRERPAAIVVAHKKFLASRLAEALLVVAAALLYATWGTLNLDAIGTAAAATPSLPWQAGTAAVLIAAAVLLKCAQLPLHGWLIQVMEAPTPVSALLHAGVVNLGGYVLIRLAPLMSASTAAETLLVVVGSLTAALAGLVMLTRITIKVRLAWSTCSQMGFMVLECGLGLYDLALLHLLAHSLYKAHAFLRSGNAVRDSLARPMLAGTTPGTVAPSWVAPIAALAVAAALAIGTGLVWHALLGAPRLPPTGVALLACGLATLLWPMAGDRIAPWRGVAAVLGAAHAYLAWHWLLGGTLGVATAEAPAQLAGWTVVVFLVLYAVQASVVIWPGARPARELYDWIYAGLYLDERFTRLTFQIWPARTAAAPPRRPTTPLRSAA